jgi:hypothetical protein
MPDGAHTGLGLASDASQEDIVGGSGCDWLAIGWFTPDYRPLAEKLAASLREHGAPFHLFARTKPVKGWSTHQKPAVVMAAMDAYPGKTLVLMDVDCIVTGDIAPVTRIAGDVGLAIKARRGRRSRIVFTLSSRVVVFRPTPGARVFAEMWDAECVASGRLNDEPAMAWAFIKHPELAYSHLDQRYIGREVDAANSIDGITIWHDSAHERARRRSSPVKRFRDAVKSVEKLFFRRGATRAELQRELT